MMMMMMMMVSYRNSWTACYLVIKNMNDRMEKRRRSSKSICASLNLDTSSPMQLVFLLF